MHKLLSYYSKGHYYKLRTKHASKKFYVSKMIIEVSYLFSNNSHLLCKDSILIPHYWIEKNKGNIEINIT